MRVPWRQVASWRCSACGKCCNEYAVRLSFYEYLKLKPTGFVYERNGKFYIRKIGNKCPFQLGNICSIQKIKPVACKLFPFFIERKKGKEEALYEYKNEEFYVYLDTYCKNVKLGKAKKEIEEMVKEAIKIYLGEKKESILLTHPHVEYPHCLQTLHPSSYTKGEPQSGHTPTGALSVIFTSFSLFLSNSSKRAGTKTSFPFI